ncbi:MAG: glycoprotein [Rhodococcus sp. (in: high G+C Gram-positive bacteria)]
MRAAAPTVRRLGVVLATIAVLLAPSAPAFAQPSTSQPGAPRGAEESLPPADTSVDGTFLSLSVDEVTPTTVSTSSPPVLTVRGTVTNVGDRPVSEISVRLQRAPAIRSSPELRTTITADQDRFDTVGPFETLGENLPDGTLKRGASLPFELSLPLRSVTEASLDLDRPGIYPVMVNVNGTPTYGQQARLDDAAFLLPVSGIPANRGVPDPAAANATPLPPDTSRPVATTLLWPLADRPHLTAGQPGTVDEPVRLNDDELASSLSAGGRLEGLVSSLEFATGPTVDTEGALASSTCIAVDPDLLITVSAMTRNYLVVDDPAHPFGPARPGSGTAAAASWLDRVRALASTMCVTALPFAQTDLAAVSAIADPILTNAAIGTPSDVVDTILDVTSRRDVVWPDSGALDADTAATISASGRTATLLAHDAVNTAGNPDTVTVAGTNTGATPLRAALFDTEVSAALAAIGDAPSTPSTTPSDQRFDIEVDSRTARVQDALGALYFEALTVTDGTPRSLTVVPPQTWTPDRDEASAVLGTISGLLRGGLATPRTLSDLISVTPPLEPATLDYPDAATRDGAPSDVVDIAREESGRISALSSALIDDPRAAITPALFVAPLREDLLRAMSTSERRGTGRDDAGVLARRRAANVTAGVDRLYGSVTILAPGGVFTLASEASPLLLVARNDLPVGITVDLTVDAPDAMQIENIGPQQLPPRGSRSLQIPARVSDSRKMVVEFSLSTDGGTRLGQAATVNVRSNAYGRALAIITAGAGALLLLLAGRRLWHRFRGQPDPADQQ